MLQTIDTSSKARSWWRPRPPAIQAEVSPEFHQAFVREVLKTERLRMKTLIGASADPHGAGDGGLLARSRTSSSRSGRSSSASGTSTRSSFRSSCSSCIALAVISWEMEHLHDIPVVRRYLNAFVETSLPTIALGVQMTHMGDERALSFVVPMLYFMFIILSTLRLDFWLSTFTGFRCGGRDVRAWRCSFRPPRRKLRSVGGAWLSCRAQRDAAGRRRCSPAPSVRSCAGSSCPASPLRRRATASPTCSASMCRRRWSNGC